jgi:hypothetical protein
MADIKFNVLEKADGKSFFIYKTDGESLASGATLEVKDPNYVQAGDEWTYPFTDDDIILVNNGSPGLEITASTLRIGTTFEDGIYKFIITSGANSGEHTEGFSALVTSNVIKESLAYRFYENRATKEYIQEKMRLLNNLAYAASVGAEEAFNTNLSMLERMQ